jgi:hypothetical protein
MWHPQAVFFFCKKPLFFKISASFKVFLFISAFFGTFSFYQKITKTLCKISGGKTAARSGFSLKKTVKFGYSNL